MLSEPQRLVARASAPAKAILVGEHFVVAGCPAIAVALDIRAVAEAEALTQGAAGVVIESRELGSRVFSGEAEGPDPLYPIYLVVKEVLRVAGRDMGVRLSIISDIPPSSGLGSSAAVAVAATAAVARLAGLQLTPEEISKVAYVAEVHVHGRPSGIDNTVATYGGAIYYRRGEGFVKLSADFSPVRFILADSGIQRSTGEMVAKVLSLRSRHPSVLDPIYEAATNLVESARAAIERGDYETLGELMNVNHGLLSALGVSNAKLEELVYAAREAGALGAKITGAGGGGMVLALAWEDDSEKVAQQLSKKSPQVLIARLSAEGVKVE